MKEIYYSYIASRNSRKKVPPITDYVQKYGIKIILSVNRPVADAVVMLTNDFDLSHMKQTYGDSVWEESHIDWEFFYRHYPEETLSIMKENGIDYKEMVSKIEEEEKKRKEIQEEFQETLKNWVVTGIEDLTIVPKVKG